MRREDFLQPRRLSFGKVNTANLAPPGAPIPASQPVPAPHISTPSTMSTARWEANATAVRPPTKSESLAPSDPSDNKPFWQGLLVHCKRMLGIGEE